MEQITTPVFESLPLTQVIINADVHDSIAQVRVQQEYYNPEEEDPVEVVFKFPKEKVHCISKLTIAVGDKVVEAQVQDKWDTQRKYEDAIAKGNTAVMLQEDREDDDIHQIVIGNLLPKQTVTVEITLLQALKVVNGAYHLFVPLTYFPK